jgi:hypothetical protein
MKVIPSLISPDGRDMHRTMLGRIVISWSVVTLIAILQAGITDWEVLGATLLLSLLAVPSIVSYVLLLFKRPGAAWQRHVCFFALFFPWFGILTYSSLSGLEGEKLARFLLRLLSIQAIGCYLCLIVLTRFSQSSSDEHLLTG